MKLDIYNLQGKKIKDIEISAAVFDVKSNNELLHQVYVAQSANKRQSTANTKDKGERKGSGRKPWKQKGTGRARTGTIRNPIWRKGGVIFGPSSERNFKKKINIKMKRKALKLALSEKVRANDLVIVDKLEFSEKKTKQVAKVLQSLKVGKNVLLNLTVAEKNIYEYAKNIDKLKCLELEKLNVYDILNCKKMIISAEGIDYLEKKYK